MVHEGRNHRWLVENKRIVRRLEEKEQECWQPLAGEGRGDNPVQEPQTREILQRGGLRGPPCMQAQVLGKGHTAQPLETRKG